MNKLLNTVIKEIQKTSGFMGAQAVRLAIDEFYKTATKYKSAVSKTSDNENVTVEESTEELITKLVGKIKGYYQNGTYYEHDDGYASINGTQLLKAILRDIPKEYLIYYDVGDTITTLIISVLNIMDFLDTSGYAAYDIDENGFTDEEMKSAAEDIENNPAGTLMAIQHEFQIRIDPYSYAVENDQEFYDEEFEED